MIMQPRTVIENVSIIDLRVPTSDTLLGSDPFHKKPNYSAVVVKLATNSEFTGYSFAFTLGAGNDWIAHGVKDLARLVVGSSLEEFSDDPGAFQRLFVDHHQLRWLADGVFRMAAGSIINAMWDLWAKQAGKPLWKLLVDLAPEKIVQCIDWRYLRDALTPGEAIEILLAGRNGRRERELRLLTRGPKAYSTAGWLGLTDDQIIDTIDQMKAVGLDGFKMKVGENLQRDLNRLAFIRQAIGDDAGLMLDANQIWGVDEAIEYMQHLVQFHPTWIEEPTARDDVLGYLKIAQEMEKYGIGVAAGEQVPSPVVFKQLLADNAIRYCQLDATRLAGVNDVLAVILMAAKYKVSVCPHGGGIGLCNMIRHFALWDQICVAAHSDDQVVEHVHFLQDEVFIEPVRIKQGSYVTPTAAGWGLEMHPEFVAKHIYPNGSVWVGRKDSGGVTFVA